MFFNKVFPNVNAMSLARAILATTNKRTLSWNELALQKLDGNVRQYLSSNTICKFYMLSDPDKKTRGNLFQKLLTEDFLDTYTKSGLPQHCLRLKINAIILIMRNLMPCDQIMNGTKAIVRTLLRDSIVCERLNLDGSC